MTELEYKILQEENKELLEWKRILSLVLKYSSEIKALNNVQDILNTIAHFTEQILHADRCTVFLIDGNNEELYSWIAHGMGSKQIRFSINKGLAGSSAKLDKTINVADAYKDIRFNPDIDKETGYRTKTLLCVPMKNHLGNVIGVFEVLNKEEGIFTSRDVEIVELLSQQAASSIESAQLFEEIKKSFSSFIYTLSEAIDARDPMTAGHSERVCAYAELIARNMGYKEGKIEVLCYAALLHDLGKIGVRESVLTKPGELTGEEYSHIQKHAELTRKILEKTYFQPQFKAIPLIASAHHENLDGTGYPEHLKGEDIPEMAKIMAVADVFDALTYSRHYRDPMPISEVISELRENSGKKFDKLCVNAFLNVKIIDVLKIMNKKDVSRAIEEAGRKFSVISLNDLEKMLNPVNNYNGESDNQIIEEFKKYCPEWFKNEKNN